MRFTLTETDTHFILKRCGYVTVRIDIAREYFAGLSDAHKIEALLVAMDKVDDHARAASFAGPVDIIADVPPKLPPLPVPKVWDATSGMRCTEDGCKYEAVAGTMTCEVHERMEVPPCASSR